MSNYEEQILSLKEATADLNFLNQSRIISQILTCIEQSKNRTSIVQEFLSNNLASAINDVISTQLSILQPSMKLIRYLMEDYYFRIYQFFPILKNILRALIFIVQSDEMKKSQLEFFDIVAILDVLMKKLLSNEILRKQNEQMQPIFMCILKFIELVMSNDCIENAVKNIMVEIYFHLLSINGYFKCISHSFELIMKVANIGDEFLNRFVEEYEKSGNELWLYKILEILLRVFESFALNAANSNTMQVKVFENIFSCHIKFILEQLMSPNPTDHSPELFKLCISILNTVLWTPASSENFRSKTLKMFVKLNADSMVLSLSKSSTKIRKNTSYSMKIFLTAMAINSCNSTSDKHRVLNTFLQSRLFNSIIELKPCEVLKNHKALILLYDCSYLRQRLSSPLNAHRVLENLLIILNHSSSQLDDDETWSVLKTFAYCTNYAPLSELEYAGVQKTSELLLEKASLTAINVHKIQHPIDKYIISLAKEFSTNISIFNSLIFLYLSQSISLTSCKVSQIIPTHNVLPHLISSDYNQVENAVKILQRKKLMEVDIDFVVEQGYGNLKVEEVIIGAAMQLIGTHIQMVSDASMLRIFRGTLAFLEAKQLNMQFSKECYICLVKTCSNLIRFETRKATVNDIIF